MRFINFVKNYFLYIYDIVYKIFFLNLKDVCAKEDQKYERFLCSKQSSVDILNSVLKDELNCEYNENTDSIHWLLFSGLSKVCKPKKILEIGTFNGQFTLILSRLFPDSEIITVDLPETDPILRSTYNRSSEIDYLNFVQTRDSNLSKSKNIKYLQLNTFFLPSYINYNFDLIWVDGGHNYPEIAWDLCNSFHLLTKGGYILCDDIIFKKHNYLKGFTSNHSYKVLEYMNDRIPSNINYFLKRRDPLKYSRKSMRKYVAMIQKK